jgi:hypothetical protein
MTSLDALETRLDNIDRQYPVDSRLRYYSFDKTQNVSLGLHDDPGDFSVFIPWKQWKEPLATKETPLAPSALQEAFNDVLKEGKDANTCFIDIATMDTPHNSFMTESENAKHEKFKSIQNTIAEVIDAVNGDSASITVRVLCGGSGRKTFDDVKSIFEKMFWPEGSLIKKQKNAKLYVGYYSPTYDLK